MNRPHCSNGQWLAIPSDSRSLAGITSAGVSGHVEVPTRGHEKVPTPDVSSVRRGHEAEPRPGGTAATGIGYAGEYRDSTGLVNLRARSYDPVLGRFIGRDTFGGVAAAPLTANRYATPLATRSATPTHRAGSSTTSF